ncbi:MAG: DUF354 domain-containing protein [Thaumarchaeota archaeon]|nr:DUF354 domain-containing protein [Nitrososphaerota archaeon]
MKVWFDVLTPKQVLFFKPIVDSLEGSGAEVLVTSRRYREVEGMAEIAGLDMRYVGERGEKGRMEQFLAATRRQADLIPVVAEFAPEVAVSIASAVCARVAFGMGVRHVAVNDSPHSETAGRLSIPLSHRLLCPWVIPYSAWSRFGIAKEQVSRYRALDPAVWLKRKPVNGPIPKLPSGRKTVVVRIEESDAPYLAGTDSSWADAVLGGLAEGLPGCNLVVLTRYVHQLEEVKRRHGSKFIVPDRVVDGRRLLEASDLFVGMGGTMTAEAALTGVPAISAFQGSYVIEDYLVSAGLAVKAKGVKALLNDAKRLLSDSFKAGFAKKAARALDRMEDPVPRISSAILETAEQV